MFVGPHQRKQNLQIILRRPLSLMKKSVDDLCYKGFLPGVIYKAVRELSLHPAAELVLGVPRPCPLGVSKRSALAKTM